MDYIYSAKRRFYYEWPTSNIDHCLQFYYKHIVVSAHFISLSKNVEHTANENIELPNLFYKTFRFYF